MKNWIFLIALIIKVSLFAQTSPPRAFNYGGVARNALSIPIANQTIGIQLSILKTSAIGVVQYQENHFTNTDAFGLFNLIVGTGAVQQGVFANIDWSNDNYYLKVGLDANGGSSFQIMGTTQLLSVPYALHSKTAETIMGGITESDPAVSNNFNFNGAQNGDLLKFNGSKWVKYTPNYLTSYNESDPAFNSSVAKGISSIDTASWNSKQKKLTAGSGINLVNNVVSLKATTPTTYTVGLNTALGGYIFYVTPDGKHGLVAATQDQVTDSCLAYAIDNINNPAFHNSFGQGFTDWRVPTKFELNLIYNAKTAIGGFTANKYVASGFNTDFVNFSSAKGYSQNFSNGSDCYEFNPDGYCGGSYHARAVRSF